MRIAVLAVFGLMMAPLAYGQEAPGWAAKLFRTEDGKIPTGHDFGTVPKGAFLRHRFPITNIYAVPLQIVPNPMCSCVTATATPAILQPRETGFLDVTMDTMRFNTPNKKVDLYVTVYSPNQQFSSTTLLAITGVYRTDVTLFPAQAEFNVVPRGQVQARNLRVSYAGAMKWEIAGVAPNESAPFDVSFKEESRQPGRGVNYQVQLALKADAPAGTHRGEVNLLTNDPNNRQIPIPYDVTVLAPLSANPDVSRFGTLKVGELAVRNVIVNGNGRPFRIIEVDGQTDGLTAEYQPQPAAKQVLILKLQPTQSGPLSRTLTIKTDLGGSDTVTVKVLATVQ